MANRYVKRYLTTLLTVREMQIKTIMRYHFIQSEWPSSKSLQIINSGEGVEKEDPSYSVGEIVNLCSHYEE